MQSIKEAEISLTTRVFVRCDLDVPIKNGLVQETFRLDRLITTLQYVLKKGGNLIIAGHIGKPKNQNEGTSTLVLKPYFDKQLGSNKYTLLENLRFDPREELNNDDYAKELANKADIYVNESFATSHRKHSSIVGIPNYLPSYAGFEFMNEIENLTKIVNNPVRPLIAIIGGAKIESKKPAVKRFIEIADYVLVGGRIGLDWNESKPVNLYLPKDYIGKDKDIGSDTIKQFSDIISLAKTVIWAGPVGMWEKKKYSTGTFAVINAIISNTQAFSLAGGGDTISSIESRKCGNKFSFISTGGGAMLEFFTTGTLPGLEALSG